MRLPIGSFRRRAMLLLATVLVTVPAIAPAQQDSARAFTARGGLHWGPRFGVSYLSEGDVEKANDRGIDVSGLISQVGWSWEQRFLIGPNSPMPMTQFVLLVGGAEQGVFLPSISWIIGLRGRKGGEIGFGPNVSLAGSGMVLAAGFSNQVGELTVPFTLATVISNGGVRASILFGFNMQRAGPN